MSISLPSRSDMINTITNPITSSISTVGSVAYHVAKISVAGQYIDAGEKMRDSATEKLWNFGKFISGYSNFEDAYKSTEKKVPDYVKDKEGNYVTDNTGKKICAERDASAWERGTGVVGNTVLGAVKWLVPAALTQGAYCKLGSALGVVGQCNGQLAALNESLFDMAASGVQLMGQTAVLAAKTSAPFIKNTIIEIVKNPVPIVGMAFIGNAILSAKSDFAAMDKTQNTSEKVVNALFGMGKLALAGAAAVGLVNR